jgi:hypothetical protein
VIFDDHQALEYMPPSEALDVAANDSPLSQPFRFDVDVVSFRGLLITFGG